MTASYDYDREDLRSAYSALGVERGKMVYVATDLTQLMRFAEGRAVTLQAHLDVLQELVGPTGTIFVPAASTQLCNTDVAYDPATTPSKDMGVFAEFVRTRTDAYRSFHPFWSVAGIGPRAKELLADVSRHAYGYGSIWQRFVEHDVLSLNVGKHPRFSVTVIHHIETVMGVPYRYNKEFLHPVVRANGVAREPFYMSVLYRGMDAVRDTNRKIFAHFQNHGAMREHAIGQRGTAWSFSHAGFFDVTTKLFLTDIYAWLEQPPSIRPYQT